MTLKDLIKIYKSALENAQGDQAAIDKAHTEYKPRLADLLAGGDGRPKVTQDEQRPLSRTLTRHLPLPAMR